MLTHLTAFAACSHRFHSSSSSLTEVPRGSTSAPSKGCRKAHILRGEIVAAIA